MPPRYLDPTADPIIRLDPIGGQEKSVHIIDQPSIHAVNAALATGRPLLVRGEPGTGKSQLARAVAQQLQRAFLSHVVDGRTETRDLLYTIDHVSRLAQAQVSSVLRDKEAARGEVALHRFVQPGPLWWAFDWKSAHAQAKGSGVKAEALHPVDAAKNGCVVLIDEIDKADTAVPNGLLEALGHGCFSAPWGDTVSMNRDPAPLILLTTNEERVLPDAFIRRAIVLHLALESKDMPLRDKLIRHGHAHIKEHIPSCYPGLLGEAADMLIDDRRACQERGISAPGLAEYIDLLWAVIKQRPTPDGQKELLALTREFTFRKHREEQP